MPLIRTGGREHAFKFQGCDHIGRLLIGIDIFTGGIIGLKTGRQNDGADCERGFFGLIVEINGATGADLFTGAAFSFLQVNTVLRIDRILEGHGL